MTDNQDKKPKQRRRTPPNKPGKKSPLPAYRKGPFNWLIILLIVITGMMILNQSRGVNKIRWDEFVVLVESKHIETVMVEETTVSGEYNQAYLQDNENASKGSFVLNYKERVLGDRLGELLKQMESDGVQIDNEGSKLWLYMLIQWLLPLVILGAAFYFIFARNLRGGAGGMLMSFGRSKHRMYNKDQTNVNFEDVAGVEEAKDELSEIIEFLKKPKKFQRLGGRIPRGVLLVGPPGCGKTLLAKAIAGEADVPFFSISGSDFVEMFVGVGASRVRDLFKQAKDNSPCIIFLDEVDAIGRKRGPGFAGGGHDEREQTLNAILVEMDGFETNDQVIVIAATNRADILDHALTRPGRFDRQVFVPLPDLKGRAEILKVHAKKVKMGKDCSLERLARGTPMYSGADLAAIINEAALAATMANKDAIEMTDLEEARDKVRWGRAKRSRVIDKNEKEITAYHEAGHTLVQSLLKEADPLHKVSIIPRGPMGGATFALPEKDRTIFSKKYCMALLQVCFGGRIAEEIRFDDVTSGAQSDIQQATKIAKQMVLTWGMSAELGLISYGPEASLIDFAYAMPGEKEYSERTAEKIDQEIRKITDQAYEEAKDLIQSNKESLEKIAKALLKYETLDAKDVKLLLDGGELDKPTVADLLAAEQAKTEAAEAEKAKEEAEKEQAEEETEEEAEEETTD